MTTRSIGARFDAAAARQLHALASQFDLTAAATVRAIVVGALTGPIPPDWLVTERERGRDALAARGRNAAAHRWKDTADETTTGHDGPTRPVD